MILSCSTSSLSPSTQSSSKKTPRARISPPSDHPLSRVNANVVSRCTEESPPHHGSSCMCGRRRLFIEAAATSLLPICASKASNSHSDYRAMLEKVHPPRPDWYEEFYAWVVNTSMKAYEAEISGYKSELFANLKGKAQKVLEIGIGTGPNLGYYAGNDGVQVLGVDPNRKMEKYAKAAAVSAGLPLPNFEFIQAVGEDLPLEDASVDAIVGTLVLCSVKDVNMTLKEVKRVLKPGGLYLFVEHVAAKEGTTLRFMQRILDPLQQTLADGCHLTRETGKHISEAGFSDLKLSMAFLSKASFVNPHVYGIACKCYCVIRSPDFQSSGISPLEKEICQKSLNGSLGRANMLDFLASRGTSRSCLTSLRRTPRQLCSIVSTDCLWGLSTFRGCTL